MSDEVNALSEPPGVRSRQIEGLRVQMGVRLREVRLGLHLTQAGLEERSGLDQTTISRFERGRDVSLRLSNFLRLLVALGVSDIRFKRTHLLAPMEELIARYANDAHTSDEEA